MEDVPRVQSYTGTAVTCTREVEIRELARNPSRGHRWLHHIGLDTRSSQIGPVCTTAVT